MPSVNVAERMEIARELCSFEGRLTGTDAERRAANRLAERLSELGRRAEVEPIHVHPQVGWIYAAHTLLAVAGSLVSVAIPALGFGLVLFAATSVYLDLNARFYLLRRLFFRRTSQNVVSRGRSTDSPARLVISAHLDTARGGGFSGSRMRIFARLDRVLPFPFSPLRLVFWSTALIVPILGARLAGLDSDWLSLVQLVPTLVLLLALYGFLDNALSKVVEGANDNASGVATALGLAAELERDKPENLDVWVVLTGGEECLMQGMRSFLRSHREDLEPRSTYLVNLDSVGRGEVRYELGEGPAVTFEFHSRLTELCEAIAEADREDGNRFKASPLRHGFATDALPARLAKIPSTTVSCLEPGAYVPANHHQESDRVESLDPQALERAYGFTLELVHQLDRDLGRRAGER